jgi:LacI family transcriptional regulator
MLLTDIAQQACVSPATVSRALNQPHRVSPESLARIRAVLAKHSYVPARRTHGRRHDGSTEAQLRRLGVWFVGGRQGDASLGWFQDELLRTQAADGRYRIDLRLLFSSSPDELPVGLKTDEVEGLILQGMEPSPGILSRLRDWPHVWFMTRRSPSYPGDYVEPDNHENGRLAARYLHSRGHRCVAAVTTDPGYSAISQRMQAFAAHARELGLTVHAAHNASTPGLSYLQILPLHAGTDSLVRQLREFPERPTGLYLPSDHVCGSFFRALREAGCKPGRDYEAVLGNYNPVIYHNLDHSPAAIDINLNTLVRRVIEHLRWRIHNSATPGRIGIAVSPTLLPSPQAPSARLRPRD